jgi:hypothetical protein
MTEPGLITRRIAEGESIVTFEWRNLRFHVVTREPVPADQLRTIERMVRKIPSAGAFADLLGMVLGRHVRIRTERPSPDVRFEVGS